MVNLYGGDGGLVATVELPPEDWPEVPEVIVLTDTQRVFVRQTCEDEPGSSYVESSGTIWVGHARLVDEGRPT